MLVVFVVVDGFAGSDDDDNNDDDDDDDNDGDGDGDDDDEDDNNDDNDGDGDGDDDDDGNGNGDDDDGDDDDDDDGNGDDDDGDDDDDDDDDDISDSKFAAMVMGLGLGLEPVEFCFGTDVCSTNHSCHVRITMSFARPSVPSPLLSSRSTLGGSLLLASESLRYFSLTVKLSTAAGRSRSFVVALLVWPAILLTAFDSTPIPMSTPPVTPIAGPVDVPRCHPRAVPCAVAVAAAVTAVTSAVRSVSHCCHVLELLEVSSPMSSDSNCSNRGISPLVLLVVTSSSPSFRFSPFDL